VAVTASVVRGDCPAHYYSRGQKHLFVQAIESDALTRSDAAGAEQAQADDQVEEFEEESVEPRRATG
jgi:hypothetical protein